jgi:hypothetical protein
MSGLRFSLDFEADICVGITFAIIINENIIAKKNNTSFFQRTSTIKKTEKPIKILEITIITGTSPLKPKIYEMEKVSVIRYVFNGKYNQKMKMVVHNNNPKIQI